MGLPATPYLHVVKGSRHSRDLLLEFWEIGTPPRERFKPESSNLA